MKTMTVMGLAVLLLIVTGCASSPTSSRTAECRQVAEKAGDTMAYGDCIRGTQINQSGL